MPRSLAIVALATLTACLGLVAATAVAVAAVQYDRNEAWCDFEAELRAVWRETTAAVHATGLAVPAAATLAANEGQIEVADLWARVERQPDGVTRLRVRYGTFDSADNRRRATLLIEDVAERLGHETPHDPAAQ